MKRLLALGTFVLLGASAWSQAAKKFSYTHAGGPLSTIFQELSAITGEAWLVSGSMAGEVVCIRVHEVSPDELRGKIAEAFRAEWQTEREGLRLIRSTATLRKQEQDSIRRRYELYTKSLDKKRKELGFEKPFDDATLRQVVQSIQDQAGRGEAGADWRVISRIQQQFPANMAAFRLLMEMDLRAIAALPERDRVVFSSHPTPAQRQLPPKSLAIVRTMMHDQLRMAEAIRGAVDENGPLGYLAHQLPKTGVDNVPAKVLLVFHPREFGSGLNCELQVANAKGKYIASSSAMLTDNRWEDSEELMKPEEPGTAKEEPLEPSEWHKKFGEFVKLTATASNATLPPELAAELTQPEKKEPLGLAFGAFGNQAAERLKKNLVAAADDNLLLLFYFGSQTPLTPSKFRKLIGTEMIDSEWTEDAAWITIRPRDPVESRKNFVPRKLYGPFLRHLASGQEMGLDVWASFATQIESDLMQKPIALLSFLLAADRQMMYGFGGGWQKLRFYGLLTPGQRQRLAAGQPLPFAGLTPAQQASLTRLVYHEDTQMSVEGDMAIPEPTVDGEGEIDLPQSAEMYMSGLQNEITELLPFGIPGSARISMTLNQEPGFFTEYQSGEYKGTMFTTLDSLAWYIFRKENPSPEDQGESMEFLSFLPGAQKTLNFTIQFSEKHTKTFSLQDQAKEGTGRKLAYQELPEAVRAEIRKKVEELKKGFEPPDEIPPLP